MLLCSGKTDWKHRYHIEMKNLRTLCLSLLLALSLPAFSLDLDSLTESIDQIIYESLPEGMDIALMVYDLTNDTCAARLQLRRW